MRGVAVMMLGSLVFALAIVGNTDPSLTAVAAGIARDAKLDVDVAVVLSEAWRDANFVNAASYRRPDTMVIVISPLLSEDLYGEGVRGLLAHELAHRYMRCDPKRLSSDALQACEVRADALAATWVGKRVVRIGLCQVMFSAWNRRAVTDVGDLINRIRLLHDSR